MRVVLVCGHYRPDRDGVADYVRRLAGHLPARGVEPVVVTAAAGTAAPGAVPVARGWDARGVRAAARGVRRLRPDVVHVQFAPSAYRYSPTVGLLPLLLDRGTPVVTTLHEYGWWRWPARLPARLWPLVERRGWWDRETLALVPGSARVLVTNIEHRDAVRRRFGGRVQPVLVPIGPNVAAPATPDPAVRAAVRRELGLAEGAPLLVFFGFVHPVKGLRYLVDALPGLRREWPGLQLLIAGGFESLALPGAEADDFEAEIRGQVHRLGLAWTVHLTGYRPAAEVSRLLGAADLAVFPFTHGVTTKSGALLAAFAHGLPVVATATPSGDPALVDGQTAVLVHRVRDVAALAAAIRRALGDAELRHRIAVGRSRLVAGRSWGVIAEAHARVYAEVCREVPGRRPGG